PECEGLLPGKKIASFEVPQKKYDFVISGTSFNAAEDSLFFKWARDNKIPAIAFVDQWINYKERFVMAQIPEHIFVVDVKALAEITQELNPRSRVTAAGTPALNYILFFWNSHKKHNEQKILYFNTEPASHAYREKHGIDDLQQLDYLIDFMKDRADWSLRVRPHPLDQKNNFERLQKYKEFLVDESKEESFEKASIMAGMRSFILLEASLLSIPVLSLQIGRKTASSLTDDRPNIFVVCEKENLSLNLKTTSPDLTLCQNTWTKNILEILA
ncbi:MAG: hypothetical protein ACXVAX_10540, partial [Pseudobdellovibrio sp.]